MDVCYRFDDMNLIKIMLTECALNRWVRQCVTLVFEQPSTTRTKTYFALFNRRGV